MLLNLISRVKLTNSCELLLENKIILISHTLIPFFSTCMISTGRNQAWKDPNNKATHHLKDKHVRHPYNKPINAIILKPSFDVSGKDGCIFF